ncbi:MAG: serine acetyltransferase [Alphaproteobacteria bacterium]|nr:serine acetyltransferase [Alphaproteobacteria bacterium]
MKPIVVLGGGGHARVLLDLIKANDQYEAVGILDADSTRVGLDFQDIPILGTDDLLPNLASKGIDCAAIGIGSVGNKNKFARRDAFLKARTAGLELPPLVHHTAFVSPSATFTEGCQIMAGVIVQASAHLGENVLVNTGAIVEHDCNIGAHTHIAPGVCLSGTVSVGENCFIGLGARLIQNTNLGNNVIVGAGAIVLNDAGDDQILIGVPATAKSLNAQSADS